MKLFFIANGLLGLPLAVISIWMIVEAQNDPPVEKPKDFLKNNVASLFK